MEAALSICCSHTIFQQETRCTDLYDLLLTIDRGGRLDLVMLAPEQATDEKDRRYVEELRRFVRGLEPWAVEHLYTSDDRVLPGRYIKACRGTDYWSIHDYLEKASDQAH